MDQRVKKLFDGEPIKCTDSEYVEGLRDDIHRFAAKMIDGNQGVRAVIALQEIKRLDQKFNYASDES